MRKSQAKIILVASLFIAILLAVIALTGCSAGGRKSESVTITGVPVKGSVIPRWSSMAFVIEAKTNTGTETIPCRQHNGLIKYQGIFDSMASLIQAESNDSDSETITVTGYYDKDISNGCIFVVDSVIVSGFLITEESIQRLE